MSTFRPPNANQNNHEQNPRVVEPPREVSQVYTKHGYDIRPLDDLPQSPQPGPIHGTVPPLQTTIPTISGNAENGGVVPVKSGGVSTPAKRPFWRTPRGVVIFVAVVIVIVAAAVVGGVVGGKNNNDASVSVAQASNSAVSSLAAHASSTLSGSTGVTSTFPGSGPLSTETSSESPAPTGGNSSAGGTSSTSNGGINF